MRRLFWCLVLSGLLLASAGRAQAEWLLVSGFNSNNVVAFDATTGALSSVFVAAGSGGLSQAEGLGFAPDGSLLVNSFGSGQVLRYNGTTGAFEKVFASISSPTGMVFRGADVFVSSYYGAYVDEFNATSGALVTTFVTTGSGGLGEAHGLTFGADGNLYVADSAHNDVLEYNGTTGAFIKVFASGGGLSSPTGITFGPNGNLYVSSDLTNQVLEYNSTTGAYVGVFLSAGSGGLSDPHGLIFRGDGDLYVSGGHRGTAV